MEPCPSSRPHLQIAPRSFVPPEERIDAAAEPPGAFMPATLEQCFSALSGVATSLHHLCAQELAPQAAYLEALGEQLRVVSEALYERLRAALVLARAGPAPSDALSVALAALDPCWHALSGVVSSLQRLFHSTPSAPPYLVALADQITVIAAELARRIQVCLSDSASRPPT